MHQWVNCIDLTTLVNNNPSMLSCQKVTELPLKLRCSLKTFTHSSTTHTGAFTYVA